MHYKKCEICGLKSGRKDGTKRFFMASFPMDEIRCKEWVKKTGNEDLAYIPIEKLHELKFVCGKHFTDKDFKKRRTQLKKCAVPSIRLTAKPLSDDKLIGFPCHLFREQRAPTLEVLAASSSANVTDIINETSMSLLINCQKIYNEHDIPPVGYTVDVEGSEQPILKKNVTCIIAVPEAEGSAEILEMKNEHEVLKVTRKRRRRKENIKSASELELTPRKKKLIRKLTKYKLKLKIVQQKLKIFDNIKSKALKTMILSAKKNQNRCAQGKRWTENDKTLAIAMYKKSPKLYRYLRQLLPLPSIS